MRGSPFSRLTTQAASELLPLDPQDLQNATIMSELVYTKQPGGIVEEAATLARVLGMDRVLTDVTLHSADGQKYAVATTPGAMYVSFMGTKRAQDWAANLSFRHAVVWDHEDVLESPAAHRGFSARSLGIPIHELYARAAAAGKRLVLCGHSLGGAVALLCTIKLLRIWAAHQLGADSGTSSDEDDDEQEEDGRARRSGGGAATAAEAARARQRRRDGHLAAAAAAAAAAPYADPNIRCITFAAPAVANESLAAEVVAAGWDRLISNFVQPEDVIVPFVNCLLKAQEGSAALERTLDRLTAAAKSRAGSPAPAAPAGGAPWPRVSSFSAAGATWRGAPKRCSSSSAVSCSSCGSGSAASWSASSGLASSSGGGSGGRSSCGSGSSSCVSASGSAAGASAEGSSGRLSSASAASGCSCGSASAGGGASPPRPARAGRSLRSLLAGDSFGRAARMTASAAVSVAAAASASSQVRLHTRVICDNAYKQTAAAVSLSMASACNLPAAETLGNAPRAPRLRCSDSAGSLGCSGGGRVLITPCAPADGPPPAAPRPSALLPARELQGGLPLHAYVAAAEAGVIELSSAEMDALSPEERARIGGCCEWHLWDESESACASPASPATGARGGEWDAFVVEGEEGAEEEGWGRGGEGAGGAERACGAPPARRGASPAPRSGSPLDEQLRALAGGRAAEQQQQQQRLFRRSRSALDCAADARRAALLGCGARSASSSPLRRDAPAGAPASPASPPARPPLRGGWSFSVAALQQLQQRHRQLAAGAAHCRALELLSRRGPTPAQRARLYASRAAALLAPPAAIAAIALLPARALVAAAFRAVLVPAAAAAPAAALLTILVVLLLALVPGVAMTEITLRLIRHYYVVPTYTVGQQWVMTHLGLEPALKPLSQYPRDYAAFRTIGGLFQGHRMKAYRARMGLLLPGEDLLRIPSYRNLAQLQAAPAPVAAAAAAAASE